MIYAVVGARSLDQVLYEPTTTCSWQPSRRAPST